MMPPRPEPLNLTEADLDFVVGEAAPDARDRDHLRHLVREDDHFRKALVGDEKVFQRVMSDEEIFLKISPALYFEVLLRRAFQELEVATHTVEQSGRQRIPIFDTPEVVELLNRPGVLGYLAQMLASFTRIRSFVMPVRVRRGVRRRMRYNDMDIDSLLRFCATANEQDRFGFYKRIADVCLFISGVFPSHTYTGAQHRASERPRFLSIGRARRSMEDYETEGRRFYALAAEHPTARMLKMSEVFGLLRQHFTSARKPLTFIASQYLHSGNHQLFGVEAG